MKITFFLILLIIPILSGLAYFLVKPADVNKNFKILLTFAGAYLFSITIIHLIPELFEMAFEHMHEHEGHSHGGMMKIGVYILIGFFIQKVLEFFSSGIEHGHVHLHDHHHGGHSPYVLLLALCAHAFMEGTILNHSSGCHSDHQSFDLLLGIVFHKAPAAFILMMLLVSQGIKRPLAIGLLVLFALASPLGMLTGDLLIHEDEELYIMLYALVAGNLLHISTTIFIESSPEHKIEVKKTVAILLGVGMAFLTVVFH